MGGVAGATAVTLVLTLLPLRDLWHAADAFRRAPARDPAERGCGDRPDAADWRSRAWTSSWRSSPSRPTTAGAYGVASVGARVLLLVPIGVTTVLFPARRNATRPGARAPPPARRARRRRGARRGRDARSSGCCADPIVTADLRREVRGRGAVARAALAGDGALRARHRLPLPLPLARRARFALVLCRRSSRSSSCSSRLFHDRPAS